MKGLIGKAIKDIETKAVTGAVDLGPVDGSVVFGEIVDSKIVALANNVQTTADTYKVLYAGAYSTDDTDADIDFVAEATESETTTPIKSTSVILGKIYRTAYIAREVADTVEGADQSVQTQISNKAKNAIEKGIFAGAFTANLGFEGITTSAKSTALTVADIDMAVLDATYIAQVQALMGQVPESDKNAWFINSNVWRKLVAALKDEKNLDGQNIKDGKEKTLFGYPVYSSYNIPVTAPIVFGDMSKYVVVNRGGVEIEGDPNANFGKDTKGYKVRVFTGGAIAGVVETHNGTNYAPFAYLKQTA